MKMNKRVLFWDIAPNKELIPDITSHLKDCDVFSEPQYAFYDFDIVIINLPNFRKRIYSLHKSCEDINTALRAGKIIFCIIDVPQYLESDIRDERTYNNYDWTELGYFLIRNLTISKGGKVILANKESKFHAYF